MRQGVLADRDGFEHVGSIPVVSLLGRVEGVGNLVALWNLPNDYRKVILGFHGTTRQLAQTRLVGDGTAPGGLGSCPKRGHGGPADDEYATISRGFHTKKVGRAVGGRRFYRTPVVCPARPAWARHKRREGGN